MEKIMLVGKKLAGKIVSVMSAAVMAMSASVVSASADFVEINDTDVLYYSENLLDRVQLKKETKYNDGSTHPWGKQTRSLTVKWYPVEGAVRYQIFAKGGKYKKWTRVKTVFAEKNFYTVGGLKRNTAYQFKVRATTPDEKGEFSAPIKLRTSRIDYDRAGFEAISRIVYHEVGRSSGKIWNEPIVHVADCVVNRYEAAKYLNDPTWSSYYAGYNSVQDMIYYSGGFMSDSGLAADGASFSNVSSIVKNAVYGALYNKATVDSIAHDNNIFFWMNGSAYPTSNKVSYVYNIPWGGYFSIWNTYWG